jgi:hypothetical protein
MEFSIGIENKTLPDVFLNIPENLMPRLDLE